MAATTTRAQLAEAISTMSFRDLMIFGENIRDTIGDDTPKSGIEWARLFSDWADAALEYESEEASEAAKAA